jgi:WD40 repeat protein
MALMLLLASSACRPRTEQRTSDGGAIASAATAPSAVVASASGVSSGVAIPPVAPLAKHVTKAHDGVLRPAPRAQEESSPAYARSMCFTGDDRLVAAIWDGVVSSTAPRPPRSVEVWDVERKTKVRSLAYDDAKLVACKGDRIAIARSAKDEVVVVSATTFEPQWSLACDASVLALAPTADRIAVQCRPAPAGLYAIGTEEPLLRAPTKIEPAWSIAYSHDGRWLAIGTKGTVRANAYVWDLATNQMGFTLGPHDEGFGVPGPATLPGDRADRPRAVTGIAFSPDDARVATGSFDGIVRLWERAGGTPQELAKESSVIEQVAFSSDGKYLAWSDDASVHVWSLPKGASVTTIPAQRAKGAIGPNAPSLAWSNDGRFLALGHSDGGIALWRAP